MISSKLGSCPSLQGRLLPSPSSHSFMSSELTQYVTHCLRTFVYINAFDNFTHVYNNDEPHSLRLFHLPPKTLPGNRLPCSGTFVSRCPHPVPHWNQPGCRTDMEAELSTRTCGHTTEDNDCPYSNHQEGLGSLMDGGFLGNVFSIVVQPKNLI